MKSGNVFCAWYILKERRFLRSVSLAVALVAVVSTIVLPLDLNLQEQGDADSLLEGYHVITPEEVESLKSVLGVQDPDVDYNSVIGGYGTGYAPPTERAYDAMVGNLVVRDLAAGGITADPRWDLSSDPCFPAVGDQGTVGSCSAWAMAYYCYGYLEAKDNGWTDASEGNPDHLMSPAWTYNKANGGTDLGSWIGDIGQVLCTWGGATWSALPYIGDHSVANNYLYWGSEEAFRDAPLHRASTVESIDYNTSDWQGTVDQIRTVVRSGTPVCFVLDAKVLQDEGANETEEDMVITSTEYIYSELNHAQTIVGYDDDIEVEGDVGAFKVVNSWGNYLDNGYYWITYEALKRTGGEDQLNQLMYMTDLEDYQPKLLGTWHYSSSQQQNGGINVSLQGGTAYVAPLYISSTRNLPDFICLDLTDLWGEFQSGLNTFVLTSSSFLDGTCSSFRTELYSEEYLPGSPSQVSEPSPDVPASPVEEVRSVLWRYSIVGPAAAADAGDLYLNTGGGADWAVTNYTSTNGSWSLQSGDVAQSSTSWLTLGLYGSGNLSFDWRMNSQYMSDVLVFESNGVEVESLTGVTEWSHVTLEVTAGQTVLRWALERGGDGGGCGWVDNISWSGTGSQLDEVPPELTLTGPAPDSWIPSSSVTVTWSAVDVGGMSHFEIGWDGGPLQNVSLETSASTDNLAAGAHQVTVRAYDRAGNMVQRNVTFSVDVSPPSVTLTPPQGAVLGDDIVIIEAHIVDVGSGTHNDTIRIDGRTIRTYSNAEWYNFSTALTEGMHVINVTSVDGAGNRAYASNVIIVDSTPPELTITAPDEGSAQHQGDIYVAWEVSDNVSVVSLERSFDGGSWVNVTGRDYDLLYSLIDGEHDLTLRATDRFGHVTTVGRSFTIDTTLPYAFMLENENLALDLPILVKFSKAMDHSSLNWTSTFAATVAWSGDDLWFTPTVSLEEATEYQIRVNANDLSGKGSGVVILPFSTMGMGTIHGRVVDASGTPIYGALVSIDNMSVTTAGDGTFTIDMMSGVYNLTVHVEGSEDVVFPVDLKAGQELDIGDKIITLRSTQFSWFLPAVIIAGTIAAVGLGAYVLSRRKRRAR